MKPIVLFLICIAVSFTEILAQHNPLLNSTEYHLSNNDVDIINNEEFQPKNENTAAILSLAVPLVTIGTATMLIKNEQNFAGALLLGGGIVIAPSAGNMYAKNSDSVVKGVQTRFLGVGVTTLGVLIGFSNGMNTALGGENNQYIKFSSELLTIVGAGLIVYSTVYDISNSRRNVQRYNRNKGDMYYSVSPIYYPKFKSVGIGFSARY